MTYKKGALSRTLARKRVRITITKDRLSALMTIKRPESGEPAITVDEVMTAVEAAGVVHGIEYDIIIQSICDEVYNTPIKIASGTPPQQGTPAAFEYYFNTNIPYAPRKGKNGRIDYRNINLIQNVQKDSILALKFPPKPGINGTGVDGSEIIAAGEKDLPFKAGANTRVSVDGLQLIATTTGAVIYRKGIIEVKDVLVIRGDVDYGVGNIDCAGSVRVTGNIRAGFQLNIGGNLQVDGNVEDCHITCAGDILVRGGCFGKSEGVIQAEGNVVVKYADGYKILSGCQVIVGHELLNCKITAKERVWVRGENGKIIGGEINAGKEIRAPVIGSAAGTPTVLNVAFSADLMREYQKTIHEIERLQANKIRVKEALYGLYRHQLDRKLAPNQLVALKKLEEFQKNLPEVLEMLNNTKVEIEERMRWFKDAVIIAEDTIYPGVEVHFGPVYRQITLARNQCKLTREGNQVIFSEHKHRKSHTFTSVESP